MTSKLEYFCRLCGGTDVCADAFVQWDTDTQTWARITDVFDCLTHCESCGQAEIDARMVVETPVVGVEAGGGVGGVEGGCE